MMSPGKLFTSLKHGDPRAVAFTAVAVFIVSAGWFSWTLLNPQLSENLPLGTGADRRAAPGEEFRLSRLIREQQRADIPETIPNPFYRTPPERAPRRPPGNQNQGAKPKENEQTTVTKPDEEKQTPPPEPTTRPVDITFHGMLVRPDQAAAALISTSDEPRRRFLAVGDDLLNIFTIGAVTSNSLELQTAEGPPEHLSRGQTRTLEIPR